MVNKDYGRGVKVMYIPNAKFGHDDIGVYQHGKLIKSFNSLSDNFAHTNAGSYAREYVRKIKSQE